MVNSDLISEKEAGIRAIRELMVCPSASAESKVIKFSGTLSDALKLNTNFEVLEIIAEALGHLAKHSPVANSDYVSLLRN